MKVIPIINIEEKILWIPKIDWFCFVLIVAVDGLLDSLIHFKSQTAITYLLIGAFLGFEALKSSMERKEQNLFLVLFHNSRIPNVTIGTFSKKIFLGVKGEIKP
jgi:hypothetical protein